MQKHILFSIEAKQIGATYMVLDDRFDLRQRTEPSCSTMAAAVSAETADGNEHDCSFGKASHLVQAPENRDPDRWEMIKIIQDLMLEAGRPLTASDLSIVIDARGIDKSPDLEKRIRRILRLKRSDFEYVGERAYLPRGVRRETLVGSDIVRYLRAQRRSAALDEKQRLEVDRTDLCYAGYLIYTELDIIESFYEGLI